jgi:hypothetical protein
VAGEEKYRIFIYFYIYYLILIIGTKHLLFERMHKKRLLRRSMKKIIALSILSLLIISERAWQQILMNPENTMVPKLCLLHPLLHNQ